jgi:hypothetical protein
LKVVVAYCQLHPKTVEAVWASADEMDEIVWADTSSDDSSYFDLIVHHWALGETFVVLEQDKIPAAFALRELHDCPEPWCTYPVPMAHNGEPCDFVSLSCTKFSGELIAGAPDLMERVARLDWGYGPKHWNRLDMSMALECAKALGRMRRTPDCHWHPAGLVGHEHTPSRSLST